MDSDVVLEREGAVATITLNRPQVRNAFGWDSWPQLHEAILDVTSDNGVRAVILTGSGGCFSSGGDLKTMESSVPGLFGPVARLRMGHGALSALRAARKPTIAAVEGFAVGVGWSVALACDFIVAAEDAYFSAPFVQRGLVPDGGLLWLLRQRAGEAVIVDVVFRTHRVTSAQAHDWGLVTTLTPNGAAYGTAMDMATSLAELPVDAVALTKGLLQRGATMDYEQFLAAEETAVALNFYGDDVAEGRASFVEKRPPRFNRHYDSE